MSDLLTNPAVAIFLLACVGVLRIWLSTRYPELPLRRGVESGGASTQPPGAAPAPSAWLDDFEWEWPHG